MKKVFCGILAFVLTFALVGCSNSKSQQSADPAPDAQTAAPISDFPTFDFSAADFADGLRKTIQTEFPDAFSDEPSKTTAEATDLLPANTAYTYDLGDEVSLTLYETEGGNCYQVLLLTPRTLGDDRFTRMGFAMGYLMGVLVPDQETGDRIVEELNVQDLVNFRTAVSSSDTTSWTYSVTEDSVLCNVLAK